FLLSAWACQYTSHILKPSAGQMIEKPRKYLVLTLKNGSNMLHDNQPAHQAESSFIIQVRCTSKNKFKKKIILSSIKANIFGKATVNEKPATNVLTYWCQHKKIYPSLLFRGKSYLGISETSAPSKQVFPLSKKTIWTQHHSLRLTSIMRIWCV
ncbi:hypothetical protein VP01_831g5, partial [Puccinia sorghi]